AATSRQSTQRPGPNRSAVRAPKGRTNRGGVPSAWVSSTQATIVFLWMSKPQQRGYKTSIPLAPLVGSQRAVRGKHQFRLRAHLSRGATVIRTGTHLDQLRNRAK